MKPPKIRDASAPYHGPVHLRLGSLVILWRLAV